MGIACFQLNIFALTQMRNTKNRELMRKSDERDMITTRLNKLISNNENWYKDPNVKLLQEHDNRLDNEQKTLDTALKDIEEKLANYEKQKENNVKNGVPSLA